MLHLISNSGMLKAGGENALSEAKKRTYSYSENADYQKAYQKQLHRILISFNPKKEEDMKLWEFLRSKGERKQIPYIKKLIAQDMNGAGD